MTHGIHHITAISSNPQRTYDFYSKVLGLRPVKVTVNFDAPYVYHLYFGGNQGEPGTVITFFPFTDAGTGMRGPGQVTKIYFAVSKESLGFWLSRFVAKGVKYSGVAKRFNESYLTFYDPDGLQLELVTTDTKDYPHSFDAPDIEQDNEIRGFLGAEISVHNAKSAIKVLAELGYVKETTNGHITRLNNSNAKYAQIVDVLEMQGWPLSQQGAGTNHHIAFRVTDEQQGLQLKRKLQELGLTPTEVIERNYFKSIYFREPNGVLYELATDGPGFNIDEEWDSLATSLKLPPEYEGIRGKLLPLLPELHLLNGESIGTGQPEPEQVALGSKLNLFKHLYLDKNSDITLLLLHGTGGDEHDLMALGAQIMPNANILSLRGNVVQEGMHRFFIRKSDGSFDEANIANEVDNLDEFLQLAAGHYGFNLKKLIIVGYSNGANFGLAYVLLKSPQIQAVVALHAMLPLQTTKAKLASLKILLTRGASDEFTTTKQKELLTEQLDKAGAEVIWFEHQGGHELATSEIDWLKQQLQ